MTQLEQQIDMLCDKIDLATNEQERKVLEAELFSLVEQLNGNTIYLTVQ